MYLSTHLPGFISNVTLHKVLYVGHTKLLHTASSIPISEKVIVRYTGTLNPLGLIRRLGRAQRLLWVNGCFSARDEGQQIAWLSQHLLKFSTLPPLSILFISLPCSCVEEMKDLVEGSEEPDSIPTDSIQSKGKGVGEALTLAHCCVLISNARLYL